MMVVKQKSDLVLPKVGSKWKKGHEMWSHNCGMLQMWANCQVPNMQSCELGGNCWYFKNQVIRTFEVVGGNFEQLLSDQLQVKDYL